ncbi:MAG: MBL fold metallo-hydrolase [Nitrospirales bacterium]|nr:MBL fold metallo-hydrolase [Nitrospirales bacterium]
MNITILGCHGSDLSPDGDKTCNPYRSVGFLVNESLLIDAGTVASCLTLAAQLKIRHVLLSHFHMDHVKELPALAVNVSGIFKQSIVVASVASVLKGLKTYIFNDYVFPNFFKLPDPETSVLSEQVLIPAQTVSLGGINVTPIFVNHVVPTVGYILEDQSSTVVFSGDTHATEEIWVRARKVRNLKHVFIETSFPNEMAEIAKKSQHLTPALLAKEFSKIGKPDLPLSVFHLNPKYRTQIVSQLAQLVIPNLNVPREGDNLQI